MPRRSGPGPFIHRQVHLRRAPKDRDSLEHVIGDVVAVADEQQYRALIGPRPFGPSSVQPAPQPFVHAGKCCAYLVTVGAQDRCPCSENLRQRCLR